MLLSNEERCGGDVTSALQRRTIDDLEMNNKPGLLREAAKSHIVTLEELLNPATQVGEQQESHS